MVFRTVIAAAALITAGALVAACSPASDAPEAVPASSPEAAVATAMPNGAGAVWQVSVIGDSSMWELADPLAQRIEEDLGVSVEVYDWANIAESAGGVLRALRGDPPIPQLADLPQDIADSELVLAWMSPEDSSTADNPMDLTGCFYADAELPIECGPATMTQFVDDLTAVWAEVYRLRDGQPTVLWAVDFYNPLLASWHEAGITEECTTCWENLSAATQQAAAQSGVAFLSRLDAFGGPEHDRDPNLAGLISSDGQHPSPQMGEQTADLLAQLGYEPAPAS